MYRTSQPAIRLPPVNGGTMTPAIAHGKGRSWPGDEADPDQQRGVEGMEIVAPPRLGY